MVADDNRRVVWLFSTDPVVNLPAVGAGAAFELVIVGSYSTSTTINAAGSDTIIGANNASTASYVLGPRENVWLRALPTTGFWYVISETRASRLSYALIQDQKSTNTAGGAATAGAWNTRTLNTEVFDPDGIVSIASNQFTLVPGIYVIDARASVGNLTGRSKIRLRNITASTTDLLGQNTSMCGTTTELPLIHVPLAGLVTIAAPTVFEIQLWNTTTRSTDGYGNPGNFASQPEIYTQVAITRIG